MEDCLAFLSSSDADVAFNAFHETLGTEGFRGAFGVGRYTRVVTAKNRLVRWARDLGDAKSLFSLGKTIVDEGAEEEAFRASWTSCAFVRRWSTLTVGTGVEILGAAVINVAQVRRRGAEGG